MESEDRIWHERGLREGVISGDQRAWKALYDRYFDSIYAHVHARAGRRDQVTEEVVQDAWMIAARKIGDFDPHRGSFEGWLRGISENVLRNHLRRSGKRREEGGVDLAALPSAAPRDPGRTLDLSEQISRVLSELPLRFQEVLRAKYQDELPVAEIAGRWGETEKAVESLLSRARAAFRESYRRADRSP
jgi:RNA polymerase sigma-70 factor, ECF subfamily